MKRRSGKKAEAVHAAELALANARADLFAKVQGSPARLTPNQVTALISAGGVFRGAPGAGGGRGTIPDIRQAQTDALTRMTTDQLPLVHTLTAARSALTAAALAEPRDEAEIRSKAEAVKTAELELAKARAKAFAAIQTSENRLTPGQVSAFLAMGGTFAGVAFTQPEPLNFAEHEGYVPIFDGMSLKGWDGNPKFWRVEDGAIVGESTAAESERQQLHRLSRWRRRISR